MKINYLFFFFFAVNRVDSTYSFFTLANFLSGIYYGNCLIFINNNSLLGINNNRIGKGVFFCVLVAIPALQSSQGFIIYSGDMLHSTMYIVLFAISVFIGKNIKNNKSDIDFQQWMGWTLIIGALLVFGHCHTAMVKNFLKGLILLCLPH